MSSSWNCFVRDLTLFFINTSVMVFFVPVKVAFVHLFLSAPACIFRDRVLFVCHVPRASFFLRKAICGRAVVFVMPAHTTTPAFPGIGWFMNWEFVGARQISCCLTVELLPTAIIRQLLRNGRHECGLSLKLVLRLSAC